MYIEDYGFTIQEKGCVPIRWPFTIPQTAIQPGSILIFRHHSEVVGTLYVSKGFAPTDYVELEFQVRGLRGIYVDFKLHENSQEDVTDEIFDILRECIQKSSLEAEQQLISTKGIVGRCRSFKEALDSVH